MTANLKLIIFIVTYFLFYYVTVTGTFIKVSLNYRHISEYVLCCILKLLIAVNDVYINVVYF